MLTSTSPTTHRQKPAPPRTPTEEPPPLPDPPQIEGEPLQWETPFTIEADKEEYKEEEANTAAMIDPATIPPSRSTLFSSSLLTSVPPDDKTPRPLRSRPDWDTPDSYPPYGQLFRRNQDPSGSTQETQARNPTPTIKVQPTEPHQGETLSQDKIHAFRVLLSKPSRTNDPIYQYVWKEVRNHLSQGNVSPPLPLTSTNSDDPVPQLWMSAVFGKTIRRIEQIIPLPEGKLNKLLDDIPKITITQFTGFTLKKENDHKDQPFTITISEDLTCITTHSKKPKPVLPWAEALLKYSTLKDKEKDEWEDTRIYYPYPLAEFTTLTPLKAQREFKLQAQEAANKWRTKFSPIAQIYPTSDEWKEGIIISKANDNDMYEPSIETQVANKITRKLPNGTIKT